MWAGHFALVVSEAMLERLQRVLSRPALGIPTESRTGFVTALALAREPDPPELLPLAPSPLTPDPEDDEVLWTAVNHGAKWLVTGNRRHFGRLTPLGHKLVRDAALRIVTPREFVDERWALD